MTSSFSHTCSGQKANYHTSPISVFHTSYPAAVLVKFTFRHILNVTTFYPPGLYHSGLVQITIFSCLNTHRSLLSGLLSSILAPLQFLLPAAAEVILSKPKTDLHALLLKTSQWFPILLSLKPRALSLTSKP